MNNLNVKKSENSITNSEQSSNNKQYNKKKLKALDRFEKKHGKSAETFLERAKILKENGEFRKAKNNYIKSLSYSRKLETIHQLMICMSSLEEKHEGAEILEQNLQYFKDSGAYWALYAFYKLEVKEYQEAFGASSLAITKFDQNFPEIWKIFSLSGLMSAQHQKSYELSNAYLTAGTENEFIVECFMNSCLQLGKFKEGLDEYEWRWKTRSGLLRQRHFSNPIWDGKKSLKGKRVLIWCEQGIGDTLNWSSYLPLITARTEHCIFECQEKIVPLLERSFPEIEVI